MEHDQLLFNPINQKILNFLSEWPQQAICEFTIRKKMGSEKQIINFQEIQYCNRKKLLAIKRQYLLQLDPTTKQVISGFKFDFAIKFWIQRTPSIGTNTLGKVQGIVFQLPNNQEQTLISLFLEQQGIQQNIKKLELFTSHLQKNFIVQKQFHQKYKAIKRIGKGVTACVYSSLCLLDRSQVAIKSFKKQLYFNQDNGNGKKAFLKEFKILTNLQNNKYISKLIGVYESENSIYIVLQLLNRTLYNYLQKFSFPQMSKCRIMLFQLLIGLRGMHKRGIMHRDIKLQNIMIRGAQKDNVQPVIVDFGLAEYSHWKNFVYIRCGTPGYVAPQVINLSKQETQKRYNQACDVFSMGIIFHILLLGKTVFQGDDMKKVVQDNKNCTIDYSFSQYPNLTSSIRDLLVGMLKKQPQQRYTVQQIMNHKFFAYQAQLFHSQVSQLDRMIENDLKYSKIQEFQNIILEQQLQMNCEPIKEQEKLKDNPEM